LVVVVPILANARLPKATPDLLLAIVQALASLPAVSDADAWTAGTAALVEAAPVAGALRNHVVHAAPPLSHSLACHPPINPAERQRTG
jgi:hypothetical protein